MVCTRNYLLKLPGATYFEVFFQKKSEDVLTDILYNIHFCFLHRLECGTGLVLLTYHLFFSCGVRHTDSFTFSLSCHWPWAAAEKPENKTVAWFIILGKRCNYSLITTVAHFSLYCDPTQTQIAVSSLAVYCARHCSNSINSQLTGNVRLSADLLTKIWVNSAIGACQAWALQILDARA